MRDRAIIAGGGIAGLAAAKVLSGYFKEVILLEGSEPAQSHHLHVLLKSGQEHLENIFPGMLEKLKAQGCPEVDWAQDTKWESHSGFFPRYNSSIKLLSMSRKTLNQTLKEDLNVSILSERLMSFTRHEVTTSGGKSLSYDFLVLATGAAFPLKRFLPVKAHETPIHLTYRSYLFETKDLNFDEFKQYYYQIDPPRSFTGGVITPIEKGMTMVTLIEKELRVSPVLNYEDFKKKASLIPGNPFEKILKDALPVSEISVFHKQKSIRNQFDFSKLPANLILLGDLHSSLNPIFGQGMSLALAQVKLLDEEMKHDFRTVYFHEKVQRLIKTPYKLSTYGSFENGMRKAFLRFFLKLCQKNIFLHHGFLKILHGTGRTV